MSRLKELAKRVPGLRSLVRGVKAWRARRRLRRASARGVFAAVYKGNEWRGKQSASGTGSDDDQTRILVDALPGVVARYRIQSMLDIPCGDFAWMRRVELGNTAYVGADVVPALVEENAKRYGRDGVRFVVLDLLTDALPSAQLVLCRDCLVHFSYADAFTALRAIAESDAEYLLATTFPARRRNRDIVTGQWRELNLQAAPFHLPAPRELINEGCTEANGAFADKSLGLWTIADVRESLAPAVATERLGR